jgi:hypothetical protein
VKGVRGIVVQFRYAFVACEQGLVAVDVTPGEERRIVSTVPVPDARQLWVARTWAYVAAGKHGLALVDVTKPEAMRLDRLWDAHGVIDDCNDVKVGITNTSLFAYLADGRNGLRVVQLTDAKTDWNVHGFSPRPDPHLIATFRTKAPALSLSRGLDRDRAVDESGNQLAVFNRVGARPLTFEEAARFYRLPSGELFTVPEIRTEEDVEREYPVPAAGR